MADAPLLKDFIDRESVEAIVDSIAAVAPGVPSQQIVRDVFDYEWEGRALKQRIRHIAVTIRGYLPAEYPEALAIMRDAAEIVKTGWMSVWAFNDFVEEYGVADPDISLPALEQFTKLASAEFAVRPFIERYPERMAQQMMAWSHDPDPLVRRLASEGYRPRLPWGMGIPSLKKDPGPIIPVLANLRDDPSEDVRRSVANNLNDISKDHPDVVVQLLNEWANDSAEMQSLTKHALRTLLKKGDAGALELLGFPAEPAVHVIVLGVDPASVSVGGSVGFEVQLGSSSREVQQLMIDYAVIYQTSSGAPSRKVFKGSVVQLKPAETVSIKRKVSLAQRTTRRIFPGPHEVEVQVNGVVLGSVQFDVVE